MARRDPPAPAARLIARLSDSQAGLNLRAAAALVRGRVADEWRATGLYRTLLDRGAPKGFAAMPRDFRPLDAEAGRRLLIGRFELAGACLEIEPGGDPWNRPSPSRLFAVALHRYLWSPDLLSTGEAGAREFLRLFLAWRELFDRVTPFAWGAETLPRRVFHLACAGKAVAAIASDAEAAILANTLAAQARHLINLAHAPQTAAKRYAIAAIAGATLAGPVGETLLRRALVGLAGALTETVLPDGGVRSRSPQAGLELLFDLLTLDDVLLQRGRESPPEVARAIDRLSAILSFFALGDGALAAFQGGEAVDAARIAAARIHDEHQARPFGYAPHSGYHRLVGRALQVIIDAAPPAAGAWSLTACGQPLAMEVSAGRDRLIVNCGWSPDAAGPQALRLSAAGSTVSLGDGSTGRPLTGFPAKVLGPRLVGGPARVEARRNENEGGVWLELAHDGWAARYGLIHERRLYLDPVADELRGEDRLAPSAERPKDAPAQVGFAVRFHLHPDVQVSLARDKRSVLLRGPSDRGWWFRNDAHDVTLEASVVFLGGQPRRAAQVVMRGHAGADGARVRWKLTPVEPEGAVKK
jgi:uncharacterized heparinase superfamily protein